MGEIKTEQQGTVLVATLDNPPHAFMDGGTVDALDEITSRADADDSIRAVVLTGSHPERFVAHYDVGEILALVEQSPVVGRGLAANAFGLVRGAKRIPGIGERIENSPLGGLAALARFHGIFLRMNRSGVVYVAAINGSTMGGGCELALACDRRIMAKGDFVIGQPEILLGFPPGAGGTQRLARLLGTGKALRVALDGLPLPGPEALELGLVDELVAKTKVVDHAVALAERLGTRPPAAIAAVKRAIYDGGSLPLEAGLAIEAGEFIAASGTEESKELMRRYVAELEKLGDVPAYDRERFEQFADTGEF